MLVVVTALLGLCWVCLAAPQTPKEPPIPIFEYQNEDNYDGTYRFKYESGNGIQAEERSVVKVPGTGDDRIQSVQGSFFYRSPEGENIQVQYTADENGFIPVGSHLPVAPPVPPQILAALESNAADEANGVFDDGKYKPDTSGRYVHDNSGSYRPGPGEKPRALPGQPAPNRFPQPQPSARPFPNPPAPKFNPFSSG